MPWPARCPRPSRRRYEQDPAAITFGSLIDAVEVSDRVGLEIMAAFQRDLGATIVTAIHAYDPELVVLAGGPMAAAEHFLPQVQAYVDRYAFRFPKDRIVPVVRAERSDHAGVLGAVALVMQASDAAPPIDSNRPERRPTMTSVRTVLGDIDAAELGVTYAHEHLVIAGSRTVELFPDFRLDDVDMAVAELEPAQGARASERGRCDAGRRRTRRATARRDQPTIGRQRHRAHRRAPSAVLPGAPLE